MILAEKITALEEGALGCSLSISWWGIHRRAGDEASSILAANLGTDPKYLKINKQLINSKNIYYRQLLSIKNKIMIAWKNCTLPYVEPGVRLIGKNQISEFDDTMIELKEEFKIKTQELENNYTSIKEEGKQALKTLYNENDYPIVIKNLFIVSWNYMNLQPPEYLLNYNPKLYAQQQELAQQKLTDAIAKAEIAFAFELQTLTTHLLERLQPNEDGSQKIFRDNTVGKNFRTFFEKFKALSITSSSELENLVTEAAGIMESVTPENIKTNSFHREEITKKMTRVSKILEEKIGVAPRRKLIREVEVTV